MDSTDADFFHNRVPAEGISRRLLIGSKFDSALIDESLNYAGDLQEAMDSIEENLLNLAKDVIIQDRGGDDSPAVEEDDIVFVSAMCSILATKPVAQWSGEERSILDNLHKRYPDWIDKPVEGERAIDENTRSILADLGNREVIDKCFDDIRRDKDQIMQVKMQGFLREKWIDVSEELKDLIANLEESREHLRGTDLAEIKKQQKAVAQVIGEIREKVVDEWERLIDKQTEAFGDLSDRIREEAKEARTIIREGVTHVPREKRSPKKGPIAWIVRQIGKGGYDTDNYEEQILKTAEIEEAIIDMEEELTKEIQEVSETIFNIDFIMKAKNTMDMVLANQLSNELAHAINSKRIQLSVRNAIKKVADDGCEELKELNENLDSTFHSYGYKDEDSARRGQENARQIVSSLSKQSTEWVNQAKKQVDKVTTKAKEALVPAAVQELKDYLDRMEKDLKERKFVLRRYELVMDKLKRHQSEIHQAHS